MWVLLAVIAALTVAGMVLVSEYQKQPTLPRLFWVRVASFVAMAPAGFFIAWPDNPVFYMAVVAISVLICLTDIMYFSAAKHYGAGVTTRIEPLSVLTAFIGWSLFKPQELHRFIDQPVIGVLIVLCFAGAGFFALRLRHCDVSSAVMRRLLPAVGIMALITMLGKTAMDAGRFPLDSAIAYVIVQCAIVVTIYGVAGVVFSHKTGSLRPTPALIKSALAMGFFSLAHILAKNVAYTHVPNPAYVTVVVLSAPLFVAGFYRLTGRRDDTDVRAGFGIVACALALVVLTRF